MTIFPLLYFPPISYIQKWEDSKDIYIEEKEHFQKQTFRNRMSILSANGRMDLSIPINHNNTRNYRDLKMSNFENWRKIHWKTLESCYRTSPYFEYYEDELHELIFNSTEFLFDFNTTIWNWIIKKLNLNDYKFTNEFVFPIDGTDYRGEYKATKLSSIDHPNYIQVFSDRFPFESNLSVLDFLCNVGPKKELLI